MFAISGLQYILFKKVLHGMCAEKHRRFSCRNSAGISFLNFIPTGRHIYCHGRCLEVKYITISLYVCNKLSLVYIGLRVCTKNL